MVKTPDGGATPAIRALRGAGVAFTEHAYEHDARAESFGLEAAAALDADPRRVYKTIVLELDHAGLGVAVVPVALRVDLKAAARALGAKRASLADAGAAQRTTGYVVGGISPFGQRRSLPTVLDVSATEHDTILVSGGRRGFDVEVAPDDVLRLLGARLEAVSRD